MLKVWLAFVVILSPEMAVSTPTVTLANVCSSVFISDPGCAQYCAECGGSNTQTQQALTAISQGLTAANAGITYAQQLANALGATSPAALAIHNCITGAANAVTGLTNACMSASCLNPTNTAQMASSANMLCQATSWSLKSQIAVISKLDAQEIYYLILCLLQSKSAWTQMLEARIE